MRAPDTRDRTALRWCLWLFLAALAVRILAAGVFGTPWPIEDERDYFDIAHSLADGLGYVAEPYHPHLFIERTSLRAPLLPVVLTPAAAMGRNGGVEAMRWTCAFFGSLVAPLAYLALRRTSLGERARWVGAVLALWPPGVYLSLRILSEPLASALLLGALAVPPDTEDRVLPQRRSLGAGLLAGLCVLARPAALIAVVLVAFTRGSKARAAWFLIGMTLVVAPWVIRNWGIHGRPLLTTHTGVTLVQTNSAAAAAAEWPGKWVAPEIVYADAPDPPDLGFFGWSSLSEEASDRRFTRDALTWVRENPGDALVLEFWKLVRLFDPDQHSMKPDATLKRVLGWATFAPVLLLAVVGLLHSRRDPTFRPWLAVLLGTILTTLIFCGDVRMRNPADPTLIALAVLAVARFRDGRT